MSIKLNRIGIYDGQPERYFYVYSKKPNAQGEYEVKTYDIMSKIEVPDEYVTFNSLKEVYNVLENAKNDGYINEEYDNVVISFPTMETFQKWMKENRMNDSKQFKDSKYLFPKLTEKDIKVGTIKYNLSFKEQNEDTLALGKKEDIKKFADEYLGYELHPAYLQDGLKNVWNVLKTLRKYDNQWHVVTMGKGLKDYHGEVEDFDTKEEALQRYKELAPISRSIALFHGMKQVLSESPHLNDSFIVASTEGDKWYDENGNPNTYEKAKKYKTEEEAKRFALSHGQSSVQKVNDSIGVCSYQFPKFTKEDENAAIKYGLKFANKDEDTIAFGSFDQIKRFAEEYLDYELNPEWLEDLSK